MTGPLWSAMNKQMRHAAHSINPSNVSDAPGVYAWYKNGQPIYVGKGTSLRRRIIKEHCDTGCDLSRSAFRRNVGEHLGVATMSIMKLRPPTLNATKVLPVTNWIKACEVAWIVCVDADGAAQLEADMKAEWMPPLTKR